MSEAEATETVHILLVDDRPENLMALETVLADPALILVKAASGHEALRQVLRQDFAVILLDVQMPGMDGFETAELIRRRHRSQHTPIIFVTALGRSEQDVFKGYTVGAVDYIIKPFNPDIVRAKVRVFADLYRLRRQVNRQAEQLEAANLLLARRAVALEAVNRELEAFSHSVSHDLRAPLRSMNGFAAILLEDYAGQLDAEGQQHLRRIRSAAERMDQLIDDLLRLSRVTQAEMHVSAVDLSAIARAVAGELRQGDPGRQADVVVADNLIASGDARLLRAALDNLLGNAWKYTGKRSTARIEFAALVGPAAAAAAKAHGLNPQAPLYFVRDDGAGFDMAHATKLFKPFQRLHAESEFQGTGIGLATVARIIHRHGGSIWAEAAPDKGATFYFTLGG